MEKIKKMKQWKNRLQDDLDAYINRICDSMSPLARLLTVVITVGLCGIIFLSILIFSVYRIGKQDGEKEFLQLQHIETLKLQKQDSLNILNKNEYEYKSNR